jgi:hypothetical protein
MEARIEISLHNYEKAKSLLQKIVDTGGADLTRGTYSELVAVALLQQDDLAIAKWIGCIRRTVSCFRPGSALLHRLSRVQDHFDKHSRGAPTNELRDFFWFQSYLSHVEIFCCVDKSPRKTEKYLQQYSSYYQDPKYLDQISKLRPLDNQPLIDGRLDKVIGFITDSSATKAKRKQKRGNDMNKPCFDFRRRGKCRFGDKCRYSHSNVSSPATKKKPCKYFSAGDCKRGDKCTFLHDVSSKES